MHKIYWRQIKNQQYPFFKCTIRYQWWHRGLFCITKVKCDKVHHQITSHNRDCTILTRMYICFLWVKEGWSDRFLLVRVRFLWLQTRNKRKSLSLDGRSTDVSLCDIELLAFPKMTSNRNNDCIRRLHPRSQNFNFGSKYYHQVNCNKYFLVDKRLR